jgi:hypothetical protein
VQQPHAKICILMQLLFRSIHAMRLFHAHFPQVHCQKSEAFGDNKKKRRRIRFVSPI